MMDLPKIRCAVCGKQVDKIELWRDAGSFGTSVEVYCHGKKDRMFLDDNFLANLPGNMMDMVIDAVAFEAPRIE